MIKKTIEYTDYNGEVRKEDFYFNLSKAEIMEMELSLDGGMSQRLQKIIDAKNVPELVSVFKDLLLKSYGVKSDDGRSFLKLDSDGKKLSIAFSQTEAYSILFMELATDSSLASEFVNGIIPNMDNGTAKPSIEVTSNI